MSFPRRHSHGFQFCSVTHMMEGGRSFKSGENKDTEGGPIPAAGREVFTAEAEAAVPHLRLQGLKESWDTQSLQNEFPTDAKRGSGLAGEGGADKGVGRILVSPLEVTHRESPFPSSPGTSVGPGSHASLCGSALHHNSILRLRPANAEPKPGCNVDRNQAWLVSF